MDNSQKPQALGLVRCDPGPAAARKPVQGLNLWLELAGCGPPGMTVEPEEIDKIVYGL